jgi:hypothetical protein
MSVAPTPDEAILPEEMESIRVGYQVATNLWWYLGDLVWAEYNAMLVVNSVVVAAIGIGLTSQQPLPLLTVGLPAIGLVLCALWAQLLARGTAHYLPYLAAARELEDEYLGNRVRVISRANEFNEGQKVVYRIGGQPRTLRMSFWSRILPTRRTAYVVISVFSAMYVLLLVQSLL